MTRAALDYGEQLGAVLDRIEAMEEALKEEVKERRGEIAKLKKRARNLRDLIAGRAGAQLDIETAAAADVLTGGGRS